MLSNLHVNMPLADFEVSMPLCSIQLELVDGRTTTAHGYRVSDIRADVAKAIACTSFSQAPSFVTKSAEIPHLRRDAWVYDHEKTVDMVVTSVDDKRTCIGLKLHPTTAGPTCKFFRLPITGTWYDRTKFKTVSGVHLSTTRLWVPSVAESYCYLTTAEAQLMKTTVVDKWMQALTIGWRIVNTLNDNKKNRYKVMELFDTASVRTQVTKSGQLEAQELYQTALISKDHLKRLVVDEANWLPLVGIFSVDNVFFCRASDLPSHIDWKERIVMTTARDRVLVHQEHDDHCALHKLEKQDKSSLLPGKLSGILESQALNFGLVAKIYEDSDPLAARAALTALDAIRTLTGYGIHRRRFPLDTKPTGGARPKGAGKANKATKAVKRKKKRAAERSNNKRQKLPHPTAGDAQIATFMHSTTVIDEGQLPMVDIPFRSSEDAQITTLVHSNTTAFENSITPLGSTEFTAFENSITFSHEQVAGVDIPLDSTKDLMDVAVTILSAAEAAAEAVRGREEALQEFMLQDLMRLVE